MYIYRLVNNNNNEDINKIYISIYPTFVVFTLTIN